MSRICRDIARTTVVSTDFKTIFIVWAERSPVFSDFAAPRIGTSSIRTTPDSSASTFVVSVSPISSFLRDPSRYRLTGDRKSDPGRGVVGAILFLRAFSSADELLQNLRLSSGFQMGG